MMKTRRNNYFTILAVVGALVLAGAGVWQMGGAQEKPFTLAQVLTALQTQGKTAETKTLAARNKYIAQKVRQRGVTFALTPEREKDLRDAGATDELINAIRSNSPPVPTPTVRTTPRTNTTPESGGRTSTNSIGMEFVKIPFGSFMMGSTDAEIDDVVKNGGTREYYVNEKPRHKVTISQDFYLGKYEVTQGQWKAVMRNNPSYFKDCGNNCPVEQVSWEDVQEFIRKLNAKGEGTYRLPTEAEWEYACRGGTTTPFGIGDGNNLSSNEANFDGNYPYGNAAKGKYLGKTAVVGSYGANGYGLYDMHGNVWEWCSDWYGAYSSSAQTDPTGPSTGSNRVDRGGSWSGNGGHLRSAIRSDDTPSNRFNSLGFRLIRE